MDDHPRSLFNELDLDWSRFARSGSARCSLQRWRRLEPVLAAFESVETLLAGLRSRKDLDHRDVVWFALLRIARTDTDARRVALFALWPGLNVVAQDRKRTRLNSSHQCASRLPSSARKKKKKR